MPLDRQLLRQYVQQGSQAAFSQLIARHLSLVYSLCLREVRDSALAEDVTQVVFLILAKKAPALRAETHLSGWLFHTARFACKNALRREARHQRREQKAVEEMRPSGRDENALWDQIGPTLNDALAALGAQEREAVLLRFFEESSFGEIGAALGTTEDAARMRLNRALERLRRFYAKEGVAVSAAVLLGLLADRAAQAAPAACAAAVTQIAESANAGAGVGGLSAQVHSQLQGTLKAMTISKLKLAVTLALGTLLAGSLPFIIRAQNPSTNASSLAPVVINKPAPPSLLKTFILPDSQSGGEAATNKMKITTFASPRSYEEVCQFYASHFLSRDISKLGTLAAEGINGKQSGYAQHQVKGSRAATFFQRLPAYTISAFVSRGADEDTTQVTLVYETK